MRLRLKRHARRIKMNKIKKIAKQVENELSEL